MHSTMQVTREKKIPMSCQVVRNLHWREHHMGPRTWLWMFISSHTFCAAAVPKPGMSMIGTTCTAGARPCGKTGVRWQRRNRSPRAAPALLLR